MPYDFFSADRIRHAGDTRACLKPRIDPIEMRRFEKAMSDAEKRNPMTGNAKAVWDALRQLCLDIAEGKR